jgi:hypothetical protein
MLNKKLNKPFLFLLILSRLLLPEILAAQEALKSVEEEYYDFLALQGLTERPYLNYRTLSDSVWTIDENTGHPWQGLNLGTKRHLFDDVYLRIYGPELFTSYNTAAPYGQNDGALWQGKGFNTSLTGGVRLKGYGVELTFKPQLAFSQNAAFDIMKPEMAGSNYAGKGDTYGYFWGTVDAPQRFGDAPFFTYDWGDSEVRYTWRTLTVGFSTQAIWLGPAYLSPMLHSNNAPTYPKFDIGLRRQPVTIPWVNWYIGDVEARLWVGYLSESEYFDNDDANDHNMFHGLSLAYAPSFLPGLTLSANRVCLVLWAWENLKYLLPKTGNTIEDQKASFALSWYSTKIGIELYGEYFIDDNVPYGDTLLTAAVRFPFSTSAYLAGVKKTISLFPEKKIYGELIFELSWMEMPQIRQFSGAYTPYFHSVIKHGYTNEGQWLGNASSPGGNSQYLGFTLYYPKGKTNLSIIRNNPDMNYIYRQATNTSASDTVVHDRWAATVEKANFIISALTYCAVTPNMMLLGGITYDLIIAPHYKRTDEVNSQLGDAIYWHNFSFQLGIKINW